jgi:hypothetical protein
MTEKEFERLGEALAPPDGRMPLTKPQPRHSPASVRCLNLSPPIGGQGTATKSLGTGRRIAVVEAG